jgi:geranylgeranyl transferase type-2 subunit alpha
VVSSIEKLRGVSLAKTEFDYTTTKTNNISNFSAWHNRAMLIPKLLPPTTAPNFETERKAFLQNGTAIPLFILLRGVELERTHNGLWVDPDDQSTWLYHSWLLGETFSLQQPPQDSERPIIAPTSDEEKVAVLQSEIQMLEELLQEVPSSKCTLCINCC